MAAVVAGAAVGAVATAALNVGAVAPAVGAEAVWMHIALVAAAAPVFAAVFAAVVAAADADATLPRPLLVLWPKRLRSLLLVLVLLLALGHGVCPLVAAHDGSVPCAVIRSLLARLILLSETPSNKEYVLFRVGWFAGVPCCPSHALAGLHGQAGSQMALPFQSEFRPCAKLQSTRTYISGTHIAQVAQSVRS